MIGRTVLRLEGFGQITAVGEDGILTDRRPYPSGKYSAGVRLKEDATTDLEKVFRILVAWALKVSRVVEGGRQMAS